jgi:membrane protein YdbS with pleckstrin-like domain
MDTDNFKKQEKIHLKITRVILLLSFVVATIAVVIAFALTPMKLWLFTTVVITLWVVFSFTFIYVNAFYNHYSYCMNNHGLFIHQGVFWRKKIVVPKNRVQHTDVTQGPLARKFNLAELIVHTAGTRNASVKVQGISHVEAESLRSSLSFDANKETV